MEWSRLPKNMKSVCSVQVPSRSSILPDCSQGSGNTKTLETETVFCFRDPAKPYREGTLVQAVGISMSQNAMVEQYWKVQGCAMAHKEVHDLDRALNMCGVMDTFHRMTTLDEFKAKQSAGGG
jgi:hypothetical protein